MNFEITIPDYLSIYQLKQIQSYEHLSELDRMIKILSIISNKTEDEIRELPANNILQIYSDVIENLLDVKNQFFPIFELNGVKYGFKSLAKMSLGEYVDLEMLTKKPMDNIEDIIADINTQLEKMSKRAVEIKFFTEYRSFYQYFLAIALVFIMVYFFHDFKVKPL